MGLFGGDRLTHAGDLLLQRGDISGQLFHPQHVQNGRGKQFFRRARQIFFWKCHKTILTEGWRGFHTPRKFNLRGPRAKLSAFQAAAPETVKGTRSMPLPLMPKATAVWLIDKTALTFEQIADFCGMHPLEVQAIADGEVAQGINGYDPVANKQVTAEDIKRCEGNPALRLKLLTAPEMHQKK